jgi:hypothetical protein
MVPRRRGPSNVPPPTGGPASAIGHGADVQQCPDLHVHRHQQPGVHFKNFSRSALMVSASVVGMPCGKPL